MLKERGVLEETLIIFLSDHGESLTEHGIYYDHHGLYDVSVRIPLIVRPPEKKYTRIDDFVQITDIAPTILSYIGIDGPAMDGDSLKPLIEKEEQFNREFVIAEEAHTQRRRMIRNKKYKLIYLLEGDTICRYCNIQHAPEKELYDMNKDPDEETNRYTDQQEIASKLKEQAESVTSKLKNNSVSGNKDINYEDEEDIYEQLEALGYR